MQASKPSLFLEGERFVFLRKFYEPYVFTMFWKRKEIHENTNYRQLWICCISICENLCKQILT